MSYTLYKVEGIVLSSAYAGESSSILFVLTEEFGLIRVWAQGVRKVHSKLAPHIQDLTESRLVLIKGREYWRLTDAEKRKDFTGLLKKKHTRSFIVRIIQMLNRLIHEGIEPDVFIMTQSLLQKLEQDLHSKEEINALEIIFMLRLLHILGYGEKKHNQIYFELLLWEPEIIDMTIENKRNLIQSINASLQESQL